MKDSMSQLPTIDFLGIRIHNLSRAALISTLTNALQTRRKTVVFYVNVHAVALAANDRSFYRTLNKSDITFCDGFGVKLGAKFLGKDLHDRMTPPDWIESFIESASPDHSFFLLGDEPNVAEKCVEALRQHHPSLRIVGYHHGFFDKDGSHEIVEMINDSSADILLIGLGMPLQEEWTIRNIETLNVKLVISVGALFRWISGVEKRAPRWATDRGFEWLFRLVKSPRKYFRRYVVENFQFAQMLVRARVNLLVANKGSARG